MRAAALKDEFELAEKARTLLSIALNVVITGVAVEYVVTHRNFLSYGIGFALAMYYLEWLIGTIKRRPGEG